MKTLHDTFELALRMQRSPMKAWRSPSKFLKAASQRAKRVPLVSLLNATIGKLSPPKMLRRRPLSAPTLASSAKQQHGVSSMPNLAGPRTVYRS
jgi:hypothetical protein